MRSPWPGTATQLTVSAKTLPSERDQNFLLSTASGERFVLKIANAGEERGMLETQNRVMRHLEKKLFFCPRVLVAQNNEFITGQRKPQRGKESKIRS